MRTPDNPLPRRVLIAFMLSGVSALTYEVIWVRLLGDLFGHTVYAVQAVLAVFFGGLALGSYLCDRIRLEGRDLLKIYAAVEVFVGVAGLLFPLAINLLTSLYDTHAPLVSESGVALLFRVAVATLLLIVPTALMGATFPLIFKWLVKWQSAGDERRGAVARLYAVNTIGGALGAWATAFLLVPLLGVTYTLSAAAFGNLIAALLALSVAAATRTARMDAMKVEGIVESESVAHIETPGASTGLLAVLLFLTGFVAISLEVLWTRALEQVLSGTIYSFSIVLAVFLLGIALGSWLYRKFLTSLHPFTTFVAVEITLANYVIASLILVYFTPTVSERLGTLLGFGFVRRGILLESLVSAFILLAPTLCMGVIFPLLLDVARRRSLVAPIGLLISANTIGSVLGAIAAGFLLLPRLELRSSLLVIACLCLALAVFAAGILVRHAPAWAMVCTGTAVAVVLFLLGPPGVRIWGKSGEKLIDYREDPAATVSVVESGGPTKERRLKVNNTYSLGGGHGVFTERRQGHLPMLLHPSPQRVLVLGVGTGNTLGAVSVHRPSRLLAAELIPGVLELAKKHFAATNYRVLENPRVQVITADALRVARATPEKYDVVIADLFHPWQAGVGSLYSREHFAAVRRTLAEGGIFCQWLPLYQLSEDNLQTIVRTFLAVYPEADAWLGNFGTRTPIVALVGSEQPLRLHWKRWEDSLAHSELRDSLKAVYFDQSAEVLGGYIGDRKALENFAGAGALNSLHFPLIEFDAPASLFAEEFESARQKSLATLIKISDNQHVPVSFEGSHEAPGAELLNANRQAVRLMILAMLESEQGQKEKALKLAIESVQHAEGYDVPVTILTELAWEASEQLPEAAEQAFREALRARPRDPNALTGFGNLLLSQRRAADAAAMFEKALKVQPNWTEATEGLEVAREMLNSN